MTGLSGTEDGRIQLWWDGEHKYEGSMPTAARPIHNDDSFVYGASDITLLPSTYSGDVEFLFDKKWMTPREAEFAGIIWKNTLADDLLAAADALEEDDAKILDVITWARAQTDNRYCQSLVKFYEDRGMLTDKQIAAAEGIRARKTKTAKAAKKTSRTRDVRKIGFFRSADGRTFYKAQYVDAIGDALDICRLEFDSFVGQGWGWERTNKRSVGTTAQKLSYDNVLAFGQMYEVCLVCATPIPAGVLGGVHVECNHQLPVRFGTFSIGAGE